MSRLPIRLRITLVFAAAMAVVLAATGLFLYFRLGSTLTRSLDDSLRSRADDITALVRQSDSGLTESGGNRLTESDERLAQVIDERGHVLDATAPFQTRPILTPSELQQARQGTIFLETANLPETDEEARLLATPVDARGRRLVIVVGGPIEDREEAQAGLLTQLVIGGPLALLLAAVAGYVLAGAALRPVEAMRRRASEISATKSGRRLPVPRARDEISRLGETLNDMLARLEAALARERAFVADASHELRTPLALLKTELELALRRPRSRDELEQAVRSAAEEADRLAQLAEDLLVIARADQDGLPVRRSPLAVDDVFDSVTARYARRAEDAGRTIDVERSGLEVSGDRLRLEQALGNLIDNALRHGRGRIRLLARQNGAPVELHVVDEGDGFPPGFLPRAFERFTRADEARSRGGTGLGLAIVEVIAAAHGGFARAANSPGGGADVWLSVPE